MMDTTEPQWSELIEEIGPALYRYFSGSFTPQMASDLVQETLIRLVKKYRSGKFKEESGQLKNYAFGIARFVRLESLKKKSDFELVDDDSELDIEGPGANDNLDSSDKSDPVTNLRWAIGHLKPIEQELVLQMIDEESTFEEMSKRFDMPVGTVKSHIHRAKEKLRQIMEVGL